MRKRTEYDDPVFPTEGNPGLTKLEYFAGQVLAGLAACGHGVRSCEAVTYAEFLIRELNARQYKLEMIAESTSGVLGRQVDAVVAEK